MQEKKKSKSKTLTYILGASLLIIGIVALGGGKEKSEEKAKTGSIEIWSYPSNADVYLNNIYKGKTQPNLIIENLPVNIYQVKVTKSGYISSEFTLTVYENQKTLKDVFLVLDPASGGDIPQDPFKR